MGWLTDLCAFFVHCILYPKHLDRRLSGIGTVAAVALGYMVHGSDCTLPFEKKSKAALFRRKAHGFSVFYIRLTLTIVFIRPCNSSILLLN
jgi:hypothetical protein